MRPQLYLDYGVRVCMSTLDSLEGPGRLALHLPSSAAAPSLGDPEQLWLLTATGRRATGVGRWIL